MRLLHAERMQHSPQHVHVHSLGHHEGLDLVAKTGVVLQAHALLSAICSGARAFIERPHSLRHASLAHTPASCSSWGKAVQAPLNQRRCPDEESKPPRCQRWRFSKGGALC